MSTEVHWILELKLKEDQVSAFKSLMEEMVEATSADEPGALIYEWFFSDDESTCHIYERYADSKAVLFHLANFGEKFAKRFMDCVKAANMTLYGNPDDLVVESLKIMAPTQMKQLAGFKR